MTARKGGRVVAGSSAGVVELDELEPGSEPLGDPPKPSAVIQWPSVVRAASAIGVSTAKLAQLALKGELQRARASDGTWRYNPVHLAEYAEAALVEDKGGSVAELGAADLLKQSVELLKQAQSHNEKMLALVLEPALRMSTQLGAENLRINGRCSELEQGRLDSLQVFERLTTEAHERELASKMLAAAEGRKQQAFGLLMSNAPKLIGQIGGAVGLAAGLEPTQKIQVEAAIELLGSMNPAQLEALITSGFVTDDQAASIRKIVNPTNPAGAVSATEPAHAEQQAISPAPRGARRH